MNTIDDVRARCDLDPTTRCWLWRGAIAVDCGLPRLHAIDYGRKTKRVMSGPTAVWNLAHEESPPAGHLVYRTCGCKLCLNPAHLRLAKSQTELMRLVAQSNRLKGTHLEQRRAAAAKGLAAQGIKPTPPEVVQAILRAKGNNCQVARRLGVHHSVVSRVRLGQVHKTVSVSVEGAAV